MDEAELRAIVIATLKTIAPEIDEDTLRADRALRQEADLDSMDWLNFLVGLGERLQLGIPEADYGRLRTLDELLAYLGARLRR